MARNLKGLISDVRPQEQPEGSYPFGKNGVQHYVKGATINEPGFLPSPAAIPGTVIGIVETDSTPVFISTDNTNSFIGLYDPVADTYTQKWTDQDKDFKLKLNTNWYIKGEFQRNYKNQMIITITDKNNPLYIFNLDETDKITTYNDVLFFLQSVPPVIEATVVAGGSLIRGAYYVFARYVRNDGAETAYIVNSAVLTVTNETTGIGDKSLQIKVTRVDIRYDKIQFAIVSKIDGQMTAVELEPVALPVDPDAELNFTYSGNEITTPATVADILVQPAVYRTVGALGQLNDSLYMGDLTTTPTVKWQKYASLIRIKFVSKIIDVLGEKDALKKGEFKTHMHGEVYAFYARLLLSDGSKSASFHIPGRQVTAAELANSTQGAAVGITAPVFQLENTIPSWSRVDSTTIVGEMGAWQNETETYPDHEEYDATDIGGENLRGKPVRHHRLPTLDFTKNAHGDRLHGKTKLDQLGIQVSNIVLPPDLKDMVVGIEILYAKRTGDNMTVVGQSTIQMSAYSNRQGTGGTIFSTGGNWASLNKSRGNRGSINEYDCLRLRTDNARFMSFDMLFNKPSVAVNYVRPMIYMEYPYPRFRNETRFADGMTPERGGFIGFKVDFTNGIDPTTPYNGQILKMTNGKYLPTNTLLERYDNTRQEQCYVGDISTFNVRHDFNTYNIGRGRDWGAPQPLENAPAFEETALCSLNTIRQNVYNAFYLQSLVTTSKVFQIDGNPMTIFGGDCFLCDYSFNTFGHNNDETPPALGDGFIWAGIRAVRRIVCVAASNINARFKVPGNPASEWYPDSPVLWGTKEQFIARITPGTEPNQFGYSKDLNTLNEISNARPWSPDDEDITDYPYRIHRGGKVNRTGKIRSWQTLLPLDFYETQKNMGRIINLCGVYDRLLIHHENALFITQDKAKLESDIISVTLGSGDIFQFEPQEAQYSKLGYAGTQHDLACVLTPMGYVFVDAKQGQTFVWNQGGLRLLNAGINVFLKRWATVKEKNPYIGNGITFGFDPLYNRLLFTVKNVHLADPSLEEQVRYDYQETPEYFATLTPGVSLVFKDGRIQRFMGPNQSPYQCPTYEPPVLPDYEFTVTEGEATGFVVGTIAASGGNPPYGYFLTTGSPYFILDATTGVLRVDLPPVYSAPGIINLVARATDSQGLSDNGNIKINVIHVPKGPTLPDYSFDVYEQQPPMTVGTVTATAGDDPTIGYAIIGGNEDGKFTINPTTGQISTTGPLDYYSRNLYTLIVRATDGSARFDDGVVTINVLATPRPPTFASYTWNILDTHALSSLIGQGTPAEDAEDGPIDLNTPDLAPYELISNDGAGTIDFDLDTLRVTLNPGANLDPEVRSQYKIRVRVTDTAGLQADAVYTINVAYDPANFSFQPFGYTCAGGDCPPGSSPSPDGEYCITVQEQPAIPPASGTPMQASPRSSVVYTSFWTYIYNPGYNQNGTGVRTQIPGSNLWWRNPYPPGNVNNGPLNRTGLWANNPGDLPHNEWIGFSRYVDIPETKTYYIGVAGDNRCRILVNGVTIVQQDENALAAQSSAGIDVAFKEWHIYPVQLQGGPNLITLQGLNTGSIAAFGAEIYDNTPAEIAAATSYADLTLIFSTKDLRNGYIDTGEGSYTCADPTYTPIDTGGGNYVCQKIIRVERTASTKTITSVQVLDIKYPGRVIVTLPNTPGQVYMGRNVPYYPPETNSPDCTGTLYTNVEKSGVATKNDCGPGFIGSAVTYNVPAGRYTSQVSQPDADGKAQVDVDRTKQKNANDNGTCSVDPACIDASEFTAYQTGVVCGLSQLQVVARTLTGVNVKVGTRAVIEGLDNDGNVVFTGTTAPASVPSNQLYLCANSINVGTASTFRVASVLC